MERILIISYQKSLLVNKDYSTKHFIEERIKDNEALCKYLGNESFGPCGFCDTCCLSLQYKNKVFTVHRHEG